MSTVGGLGAAVLGRFLPACGRVAGDGSGGRLGGSLSRGGLGGRVGRGLVVVVVAFGVFASGALADPFVYVTNRADNTASQFDGGAGGVLFPDSPATVATGSAPLGVAVAPDGSSVYVTNFFDGTVSEFDVSAGGVLSPKSPATVATGSYPEGVAVSPDGSSVYVTNTNDDTVSEFAVGAGGVLTPMSPATVAAGNSPTRVAVSPDGSSVYVTNYADNTVSEFDVGTGGVLMPKTPATVATGVAPQGVVVSPDGKSVYVTNTNDNTVSEFDVGAGGVLTTKTPATVTTGNYPVGVAVSPDGSSVYVTNYDDNTVSEFDVGAGGVLSPKSPATVAVGSNPVGVAVSPDGRSVYVTNQLDNTVSEFDVGTGGVLSPKSPATVATGTYPEGIAVRPPPGVLGVSPQSGPVSGGTPITITGSGFVAGATVEIGQGGGAGPHAIPASDVTVVSSTEITATTGGPAKGGSWNVFVTDSGGTTFPNSGDLFTYTRPSVTGVSPSSGPVSGGTPITITGTGFLSGAAVEIGQGSGTSSTAIPATNVDVVSPTEITAITGGPAHHGTWNVFVTQAGTASPANHNDLFTYTTARPATRPLPTHSRAGPHRPQN